MQHRVVVLVLALILGFVTSAHADPITWNLLNVHFSDGGTAAGYITYDAARHIVVDFDVRTTDGVDLQAFEYIPGNTAAFPSGQHSSVGSFSLSALTDSRQLYLEVDGRFGSPGTLDIDDFSFERCNTGPCLGGFRTVQGQLTSAPEPWSLALLGTGLMVSKVFIHRTRKLTAQAGSGLNR